MSRKTRPRKGKLVRVPAGSCDISSYSQCMGYCAYDRGPPLLASGGIPFFIHPHNNVAYRLRREKEENRFVMIRGDCVPAQGSPVYAIGGLSGYRGQQRLRFVTSMVEYNKKRDEHRSVVKEFDQETARFSLPVDGPLVALASRIRHVAVELDGEGPLIITEKEPCTSAHRRDVNRRFISRSPGKKAGRRRSR